MSNKKITIINIILVFVLSFITHFIYNIFPNNITASIFPTNESIAEHLKMAFNTYIIVLIIDKYILKVDNKNLVISIYMSAIATVILLTIIFPIYFSLFGENLLFTLIIYLITIIIGSLVGYKILNKKDLHLKDAGLIAITLTMIIFALLTFYPLNIDTYFRDYSIK